MPPAIKLKGKYVNIKSLEDKLPVTMAKKNKW